MGPQISKEELRGGKNRWVCDLPGTLDTIGLFYMRLEFLCEQMWARAGEI